VRLAVVEADAAPVRPAVPRRPGRLEHGAVVPVAVANQPGDARARRTPRRRSGGNEVGFRGLRGCCAARLRSRWPS
jgi:hypothetical protein